MTGPTISATDTPTQVTLYSSTPTRRPIAVFRYRGHGGVTTELLDPAAARSATNIYESGVELPGHRQMVPPSNGALFMRTLLEPVPATYHSFRDKSRESSVLATAAPPPHPPARLPRVTLYKGVEGIYKPISGESTQWRPGVPGDLGIRATAASRVDETLGFGRIPTTTMIDGPAGPGSWQQLAVGAVGGRPVDQYLRPYKQQMAVLDYIIGNTARRRANYLTGLDGSALAIDNEFSFPESPRDAICSEFVQSHRDYLLDQDVVTAVRRVDRIDLQQMLQYAGLGTAAVELTMARLAEIQQHGMITGEGWPGRIDENARPSETTTSAGENSPTRVAMYASASLRRVAVFSRTSSEGGVTVDLYTPQWAGAAAELFWQGIESLDSTSSISASDGGAYMRGLLRPLHMSYYTLQDESS